MAGGLITQIENDRGQFYFLFVLVNELLDDKDLPEPMLLVMKTGSLTYVSFRRILLLHTVSMFKTTS